MTSNNERQMVIDWMSHSAIMDDLFRGKIKDLTMEKLRDIACSHGFTNISKAHQVTAVIGRHAPDIEGLENRWATYSGINKLYKEYKKNAKRHMVGDLGLKSPPKSYINIFTNSYIRTEHDGDHVKRWSYLVDKGNETLFTGPKEKCYVVGNQEGWLHIPADKSAVILDPKGNVEMFILRNVAKDQDILDAINHVMDEAIGDRRGVRPTDPGKQVQFGYNAGPRHLRVFGLVRNIISKKWSKDTRSQKDRKILGIMSLFWNMVLSHAPKETTAPVLAELKKSEMPCMASVDDQAQQGYSFELANGIEIRFNTATRAPPEGYIAMNYSSRAHTDRTFVPFAFSWQTYYNADEISLSEGQVPGGNFTNLTLGVTIESSGDSIMGFKPIHLHGTTLAHGGLYRGGLLLTCSSHIKKAFERAQEMAEGVGKFVEISLINEDQV